MAKRDYDFLYRVTLEDYDGRIGYYENKESLKRGLAGIKSKPFLGHPTIEILMGNWERIPE